MFALTYCFDQKMNKILMIEFKNKITLIIYYSKHRINIDNYSRDYIKSGSSI